MIVFFLRGIKLSLFTICSIFLFACAERTPDINRVQANLIAKSDLDGEWYMMQTVVDLPPTTYFTFIVVNFFSNIEC